MSKVPVVSDYQISSAPASKGGRFRPGVVTQNHAFVNQENGHTLADRVNTFSVVSDETALQRIADRLTSPVAQVPLGNLTVQPLEKR